MGQQVLGGYTFEFDPEKITIIESDKIVVRKETLSGSAIFEWTPSIVGKLITMEWDWMYSRMYKTLRRKFLNMGVTYSWTPVLGGSTYTVKIVKLEGKILAGMEADSVYREGVKMELDIRSVSSYAFTTTSTTTTLL